MYSIAPLARRGLPPTLKRVVRRVCSELNKREEGSASRALNSNSQLNNYDVCETFEFSKAKHKLTVELFVILRFIWPFSFSCLCEQVQATQHIRFFHHFVALCV